MNIIGSWILKSCVAKSATGEVRLPYGLTPKGQLTYSHDGKMNVFLMNSERKNFSSEDISLASESEKALAFDPFDAYAGTYPLNQETRTITHHIELGKVPNWVGSDHIRNIQRQDSSLVLRTMPFQMAGISWEVELIWDSEP